MRINKVESIAGVYLNNYPLLKKNWCSSEAYNRKVGLEKENQVQILDFSLEGLLKEGILV